MKQEFKVGDWVTQKSWNRYYEVTGTDGKFLTLLDAVTMRFGSYNLEYAEFIKKEEPVMKGSNEATSAVKNKIDPSKKYRKVNSHEPVRIICTDRVTYNNQFPVVALIAGADGREDFWALDDVGVSASGNKIIEEIPQTDWSKVQFDTLIWVGNTPRYFHAYSAQDGFVCFYKDGTTSVTNTSGIAWACSEGCSLEKPNA